jgi:hypothetical protein
MMNHYSTLEKSRNQPHQAQHISGHTCQVHCLHQVYAVWFCFGEATMPFSNILFTDALA